MSLLGSINDGRASWRAMQGEYTDGGGEVIVDAIGSTVLIDVHRPQIGFVCFASDAAVRERFGQHGTPEAAAAKAAKPKFEANYAIRLAIVGDIIEARDLTACNKLDRSAIEAFYAAATNAAEFSQGLVPEVRLGRVDATNAKYPDEPRWSPSYEILGWVTNPWAANPSVSAVMPPVAVVQPGTVPVDVTRTEMTVEEMTKAYEPPPPDTNRHADIMAEIRRKTAGVAA